MPRLLLLVALLLIATPAIAQIPPSVPLGPSGEQGRSLSLKNMSHQTVVFVHARMTDGKAQALTYSSIEPGHAQEIIVPRKACLAEVVVRLNDGRSLKARNLDDCRSNALIVGDKGIDLRSAHVPQLRRGKLLPSRGG